MLICPAPVGQLILEYRDERAGTGPAEVAAERRRTRVLGFDTGDVGKILAVLDPPPQLEQLLFDRGLVQDFVGLQQDMADPGLQYDDLLGAADVVELEQMEAAGAADRVSEFARLKIVDGVEENRRQLRALAPAQVTTVQRVLALGIFHGELGNVLARDQALVKLLDTLTGFGHLFRGGIGVHRDQDMGQLVVDLIAGATLLFLQKALDFPLGDRDPATTSRWRRESRIISLRMSSRYWR